MINHHLTYLRHKNGKGKIFDQSEVCEKSFADYCSEIREDSSIWNSRIIGSRIESSLITNSVIKNSVVIASNITGGIIEENSIISCELITGNVRIKNCQILGKSRVAQAAVCENVKFKNLTVKGTARLKDWEQTDDDCFDGFHGYVSRGVWTRPPRIFRISEEITITESVFGFAFVQCREYSLEHWLKVGKRYGERCGWTQTEITKALRIIRLLQEKFEK